MFRVFLFLVLALVLTPMAQAQVICENGQCRLAPVRSLWQAEPVYVQRTLWAASEDCTCTNCTCGQAPMAYTPMATQWTLAREPVFFRPLSKFRHRLRGLFCR